MDECVINSGYLFILENKRLVISVIMGNKQRFHYEYVSLSFSQDELVKAGGISVFMAAMFVSGELAGTGVLALPQAVGQSGGNPL